MVDGYMRNDIFTIDRVHQRLVFRIDKKLARAQRISQ
jgi:type IV secretion system protein VirB9